VLVPGGLDAGCLVVAGFVFGHGIDGVIASMPILCGRAHQHLQYLSMSVDGGDGESVFA